jgi:hypothetical protein
MNRWHAFDARECQHQHLSPLHSNFHSNLCIMEDRGGRLSKLGSSNISSELAAFFCQQSIWRLSCFQI